MLTEEDNSPTDGISAAQPRYGWLRVFGNMTSSSSLELTETKEDEEGEAEAEAARSFHQRQMSVVRAKGDKRRVPLSEEEVAQLPAVQRFVLALRFGYCVCAAMVSAAAFIAMLSLQAIFLAAYSFFFSLLICCSSLPFPLASSRRRTLQYFGFLRKGTGRLVFSFILSIMLVGMGLLGWISIAFLAVISIAHIVLECTYGRVFVTEFSL